MSPNDMVIRFTIYQAKVFVSKQDVYQIGLIPKQMYTEVPLYMYEVCLRLLCGSSEFYMELLEML